MAGRWDALMRDRCWWRGERANTSPRPIRPNSAVLGQRLVGQSHGDPWSSQRRCSIAVLPSRLTRAATGVIGLPSW